jgi:P27 family predicted phage terminase small subunit
VADPRRKKPPLAVVREGNPGKRPIQEGVTLPPAELTEPDWTETFADVKLPPRPRAPADADEEEMRLYRLEVANYVRAKQNAADAKRAREVVAREWKRIVPVLTKTAGLAEVDVTVLTDYCICVARIDQGERSLSRDGALMLGERGWQKNGWTTITAAYRNQLKAYIGELGLSPSARGRLSPPEGDDDGDDVFDWALMSFQTAGCWRECSPGLAGHDAR